MEQDLEALRIEPEEKGAPEGKRPRTSVALGLAFLGAVMALLFAWQQCGRAPAVEVAQAVLQQGPGGTTLLTAGGYVVPERYATVSAKIAGQLVQLAGQEGEAVTEGQVIARLDARELRLRERAEALGRAQGMRLAEGFKRVVLP